MVDQDTFLGSYYPEFELLRDGPILARALAQAAAQTNAAVFEEHTDAAHAALTAHILASTPNGREARLAPAKGYSDGATCYSKERDRLAALVATHRISP